MNPPPCPACDALGARFIQRVAGPMLRGLWRACFGIDPGPIESPNLFECHCGLRFFHPARAGNADFYRAAYASRRFRAWMTAPASDHADFLAAAAHIRRGDRVLDVGGHGGAFATLLPAGASCTVIDPYADQYAGNEVLCETAAAHAARLGPCYDVVTAFQVIEHVEQPQALLRDMLACLKPGGLLALAGPSWPSHLTELPNMVVNAPPHHLTWWSPRALSGLAERHGLEVLEARNLTGTAALREIFYWPHRLLPRMPLDAPFRAAWSLHARLALVGLAQPLLNRVFGVGAPGFFIDCFLLARKPCGGDTVD